VTSPILSPLPSSAHSNAPLTPLSQALFQNLQLHGSIQGPNGSETPHGHSLTAEPTTTPAAEEAPGDSEARILLNDVPAEDIHVRFMQHMLASERSFGKVTANPSAHPLLPLLLLHPPLIP
jgi:hypothetical protein